MQRGFRSKQALVSPQTDLAHLRSEFPFLGIMPPPYRVVALALTQNVAAALPIPDGAKMMVMRGNMDYYVSFQGAAVVPTTLNTNPNINPAEWPQSFYAPEGFPIYVGQSVDCSIISPFIGCVVTVAFWGSGRTPYVG